jgi:hypothetical protein
MNTRLNPWLTLLLPSIALALLLPVTTLAGLNGQGVNATMTLAPQAFQGFTQFSSPAIVGPGVEFSGLATDVFGQVWDIHLDLSDSSFMVSWTERTRGQAGNISYQLPPPMLQLDLATSQPVLSTVAFSNHTSTNFPAPGSSLTSLNNTDSSVRLAFNAMYTGETYIFNVTTVPEPSSFLLAIVATFFLGATLKYNRLRP